MATTEVIVTKFIADTGELDAQLDSAVAGLKDVETQGKKTEKETANLGATMGSTAVKVNMMTEAEARLIMEAKAAAKALDAEGKSAKGAATELTKVGQAAQATGKQTGGLQGIFGKLSSSISTGFGKLKGLFSDIGSGAKSFTDTLTNGIQSALPSVGGLGSSFSALGGPIALAAGAVVGFIANFSRLDGVKTALEGVKIQFDGILNRVASLQIASLFDPGTLAKDAALAQGIAEEFDRIDEAQNKFIVNNAKAETQTTKLNIALKDRTKTDAERLAIADQLTQIETKRSEDQIKLLEDQKNAINAKAVFEKATLKEVSDETKKQQADAAAAVEQAKAASISLTERVQNRINAINEDAAQKEAARQQKAVADAEKEAAERERIAKERAALEGQLIAITAEEEDAQLRKSLSTEEQRLFDIEKTYEKKAEAIRKLFESLKALPGADIPKLDAQQAQALSLNETGKKQDTTAEEQKQRADREKAEIDSAKRISDALSTEDERQREGIKDKYAKLLEDNDKYTTDVVERDKKKNDLLAAQAKELNAVLSDADEERIKKEKEDAEAKAKLQADTIDVLKSSAESAAVIIGEAAAAGTLTAEDASKQLVTLALDTIEKLVLLNAINAQTGALAFGFATGNPVAGIIAGIAVSALIKGLFAAAKATIAGAYYGEESIGGPATFPGEARDTHLRRVHPGERIVTADKNRKHWQLLHALHTNKLDDFIERQYIGPRLRKVDGRSDVMPKAMPHAITGADVPEYVSTTNVMPTINAFLASERGHRVQVSVMPSMFHDKGIRDDLRSTRKAIEALPERISKAMEAKEGRQRTTRQARSWK